MEALSQTNTLYEQDYYLWLLQTSQLLREGQLNQLDIDNLIEEIESMERSEKKEVKSQLIILIEHLLKLNSWQTEKEYNAREWCNTVVEQRLQINLSLDDSPSLIKVLDESFLDCYDKARISTLQKYQLSHDLLPLQPPFSLEDILNSDYLP